MVQVIQPQVDCSTAYEFLDALSPVGQYFKDAKLSEPWLFRGQGKDYPLIPSAFRPNTRFARLTKRDLSDYTERQLAERDVLLQFFDIADRRGLILPDDSQQLRTVLENLKSERGDIFVGRGYNEWQTTNLALSLAALAQHYGLPTRLLDWTRQAFVAAFFAAEGALRANAATPTTDRLVVWAFYFPVLGKHDEVHRQTDPIRIVTAPSATNPNLKAQQGVFTLLHPHYTKEATDPYPPMDELLERMAQHADPDHSDMDKLVVACRLRKFTAPASEAPQLLYLLAKLDITPSAVYPGYQSIVADLEIQNRWS